MKPGKYKAKVAAAGVVPGKKPNEVQPFIKFDTAEGSITWFGHLSSEKATELAIKNAVTAGFQGNDWDDFAKGLPMFDGREVEIDVQDETFEGKKTTKVKWINPTGGGKLLAKAFSSAEVKSKVSHAGLFKAAKQKAGTPAPKKDEVPF